MTNITHEEAMLVNDMYDLIDERNELTDILAGEYWVDRIGSPRQRELERDLKKIKDKLKEQRKKTLGKIYYSNRPLWKALSSPLIKLDGSLFRDYKKGLE